MNQPDLFTELDARDVALDRIEDANHARIDDAYDDARARIQAARPMEKMTSDTILPDISRYNFTDGRAVGAIMRKLISANLIRPVRPTEYRPSTRPGNHAAPRRVYIKSTL